jgi:hypothetical protein
MRVNGMHAFVGIDYRMANEYYSSTTAEKKNHQSLLVIPIEVTTHTAIDLLKKKKWDA